MAATPCVSGTVPRAHDAQQTHRYLRTSAIRTGHESSHSLDCRASSHAPMMRKDPVAIFDLPSTELRRTVPDRHEPADFDAFWAGDARRDARPTA